MDYGKRLRLARKQKKLSQDKLAELSGVNQASISKIERGDQGPSAHDVSLANSLSISPMWLRTGESQYAPSWITGIPDMFEITCDPVHRKIMTLLSVAKMAAGDAGGTFTEEEMLRLYKMALDVGFQTNFDEKKLLEIMKIIVSK